MQYFLLPYAAEPDFMPFWETKQDKAIKLSFVCDESVLTTRYGIQLNKGRKVIYSLDRPLPMSDQSKWALRKPPFVTSIPVQI